MAQPDIDGTLVWRLAQVRQLFTHYRLSLSVFVIASGRIGGGEAKVTP